MKLKKVAAAVMAGTLAVFTMTGCSEQVMNYSKETEKIASWEGTETTVDGTISMDVMGQSLALTFNADGYMNGKDKKGYMNMKFNGDSSVMKLPNMNMYIDKSTAYINKDYFTSSYKENGIEIPKQIDAIPAEYIGIDTGIDVEKLSSASSIEALNELKKQFIGDVDINIPMSQTDREYTINLNDEQIADIAEKIINGAINNMDTLNSSLNLGLNDAALEEIKATIKSDDFKNSLGNIKNVIAGSSIASKEKFEDDSYTSDINIDLKIKDLGNITMKLNSKSTKAAAKEVEVPLGRVKFTQKQYMETFMPVAVQEDTVTESQK